MRALVISIALPTLALGQELRNDTWNDDIFLMDGTGKADPEPCPRPGESGCYEVLHGPIIDAFWDDNSDVINAQGERLWDTVVAQSSFPFASDTAFAFYSLRCNEVSGIHRPVLFDIWAQRPVNACTKPTGYSFMNNALEFVAGDIKWMLDIMGEEMGHQFCVFVDYRRDGECSDGLRGRQRAHWAFWVNTGGSVMEGNKWQDQADGTFLSLLPAGGYSDMDLYLWGFIPPEEVRPFFIIDDPVPLEYVTEPGRETGPTENVLVQGTRYDVTIDDIIACEGLRAPSADHAPKVTREALILVSVPGEPPDQLAFDGIRRFRREWNEYFYRTTHYTARAITTRDGVDDMPWWEFGHREEVDAFDTAGVENLDWISDTEERIDRRLAFDVSGAGSVITLDDVRVRPSWSHYNFETEQIQDDPLYNAFVAVMSIEPMGNGEQPTEGHVVVECGGEEFDLRFPLVPDGQMHTYSAAMPDDWDCDVRGFRFYPADAPAHVEVDRIRFSLGVDLLTGQPANGDRDGDGFLDAFDNCPSVPNPTQADGNRDGFGDACEDTDRDGMPNGLDNCPLHFNSPRVDDSREGCDDAALAFLDPLCLVQDDEDGDGIGDVCDPDSGGCSCAVGASAPRGSTGVPFLLAVVFGLRYASRRRGSIASRRPSPTRL